MGTHPARFLLFIILTTGLALAAVAVPVAAASNAGDRVSQSTAIPGGFCGDGICDQYANENPLTCPQDCVLPTPLATSTLDAVETPTATLAQPASTGPPPTLATAQGTPATTVLPTTTPTFFATENVSGGTPTPTGLPTYTPTADVLRPPGCGLVSYESRPEGWKQAYAERAHSSYRTPVRADDLEVYLCEIPPVGRLCFLMYEGLLDAAQGNTDRIQFVDCTGSSCTALQRLGQKVGDQFCYDIVSGDDIVCDVGCAMALLPPGQSAAGGSGVFREISPVVYITLACLLGALLLLLFLFLLARRRRRGQGEEGEEQEQPEP